MLLLSEALIKPATVFSATNLVCFVHLVRSAVSSNPSTPLQLVLIIPDTNAGRSAPFRPGYPITSDANAHYRSLIPEKAGVLSHASLKVGSAPCRAEDHDTNDAERQTAELKDWENHMTYLKSTFAMLANRGVTR